jgi:hypothetical protein
MVANWNIAARNFNDKIQCPHLTENISWIATFPPWKVYKSRVIIGT